MNYQHLDGEDAVHQISKNQSWKIIDYVYIAMKLKNEREKMVLRLYDNAQAEDLLKEQAAEGLERSKSSDARTYQFYGDTLKDSAKRKHRPYIDCQLRGPNHPLEYQISCIHRVGNSKVILAIACILSTLILSTYVQILF